MKQGSILARLGGQLMAVDPVYGRECLSSDWPAAAMAARSDMVAGTDLKVERGERFVSVRGVAVMPIRGILTPNSEILERYLGWATYAGIEAACAEIAAADDVGAAVLEVDCPGGTVLGLAGAVASVATLAAVKTVYVLANPLAASAAYAIASQATSIAMTSGAYVGSIGVIQQTAAPVQPDMYGDQWNVHVSSHARAKWADPRTDAGLAEIRRGLDEFEAVFHADVARGRGIAPDALAALLSVTDDPADGGAVFQAAEAIRRKLADTMETRAAFYDRVFAAHAPQPARTKAAARAFSAQAAAAAALANC
ncbi:S49 family peptidase [Pseudotabrizicola sp. 4114]|uniref:S49 family peptidase n=1 Tax=Pseudotabrizicola sp. 4114 TaxID=2817731 RepID=UPI0028575EED|nr:ClpP class serine protease [Pseudorhodobacter sp. 4114]